MENYGTAQSTYGQPAPQRTATESDHIVSRLSERLDALREMAKRVERVSDRLCGPRPRELSKEAAGSTPPGMPFAQRMNNLDAQMQAAISDCQNALGALESFV